jgi:hypothetical protein
VAAIGPTGRHERADCVSRHVPPEKLSSKMANTLSASNRLHGRRDVDAARTAGNRAARKYPAKRERSAK